MHVILNAPAVKALLAQDPDFFGELGRTAAAQVAEEFRKKNTLDAIARAIDQKFVEELQTLHFGRKPAITQAFKDAIKVAATEAVESAMKTASTNVAIALVNGAVAKALPEAEDRLTRALSGKVDQLVKERIARAFGALKA